MNPRLLLLPVFALPACAPEATDPGPQQIGSIEVEDGTAEVWDSSTYFYAETQSNGDMVMAILFSGAEDLSCADLAAAFPYSSSGELENYDPRPANVPGTCTLTLTDPKWDGSLQASLAEGESTLEATISLDCFLEGGEWDDGADGWAYSPEAKKWNARPSAFELDIQGDEASGATWTLDMPTLEGKPYGSLEDYAPITGSVSGSGDAPWCADLASSSLFGG